jgi:hypothetical protein
MINPPMMVEISLSKVIVSKSEDTDLYDEHGDSVMGWLLQESTCGVALELLVDVAASDAVIVTVLVTTEATDEAMVVIDFR